MESKGDLRKLAEDMRDEANKVKDEPMARPQPVKDLSKNEEAPILQSIFEKREKENEEAGWHSEFLGVCAICDRRSFYLRIKEDYKKDIGGHKTICKKCAGDYEVKVVKKTK